MKNQRGLITVDFLFSIVLVFGFTALMFVLMFTLSVVSVAQYITFASARNYAAAHLDVASQSELAKSKYKELLGNKTFKPLFNSNWFLIDADVTPQDQTKIFPEYEEATHADFGTANKFWGVGTHFTAKVLAFQIPFFGTTVPDGDQSGAGFKTYIGSYLGREPTAEECWKFTLSRWTAIRNLPASGGAASYASGTLSDAYFPMADDGC